ncbi:MAG: sulfite exporter TauE/SafE family protein [Micrococcales bacterium]|nr:sulfite exporter TauE/SafE family protein [Micrococcales bacterium]
MDLVILALIGLVVFAFASAAQATTGFGYALVAVPIFALAVDTHTAVVATTALGFVLTASTGYRERAHVQLPTARRIFVASLLGMPLGLVLLSRLDGRWLSLVIGVTVLVLVVLLWRRVGLPTGAGVERSAGVVSGVLLTATGMNGPPVALALQASNYPAREFRATIQAIFVGQDLIAVIAFGALGFLNVEVATVVFGGLAGIPIGWLVGDRLVRRMSEQQFRAGVLLVLVATAGVTLISVVT